MVALGCKPDSEDRRDYPARMMLPRLESALPKECSWRALMSGVRDQGNLGSCVGFACAAMKEFQELQQRPNTPFRNASEMWIYWKAKEIDVWPNEEGTSIRDALKVLYGYGVPTEKAWPYTDKKAMHNKPPTQPAFWSKIVARWGKIGSYYRLNNVGEIKEWLYLHGPVVVGIPVGQTIFDPVQREGVKGKSFVRIPQTILGGHAILFTGYDDTHRLFQFKNSWSVGWGDRGYGYISYDYLDRVQYDAWATPDAD
jgi:C1A family cysteine protease